VTLPGDDHEKFNALNDDETVAAGTGTQAFRSDLLPAFAGGPDLNPPRLHSCPPFFSTLLG
jgi:hypothetical protein